MIAEKRREEVSSVGADKVESLAITVIHFSLVVPISS